MNAPLQISDLKDQVDFAVVTVRDDEFEAVLERFEARNPVAGGKQLYEYCPCATDAGTEYGVAVVHSLEQGQTAAQSVARDVIEDLDPGWLILTGIAGGIPDSEFSLGDVLLASRLHDFSVSAAMEGKPPEYEQMGGPIHPDVERLLAALPAWRARLGNWNTYSAIGMEKPRVEVPLHVNSRSLYGSRDFRRRVRDSLIEHFPESGDIRDPIFKVGPGASAGILLKDSTLLENWRSSARHLTHVEMEAGGVYEACRHGGRREYPLLCVRGISDIVGFRRSPGWTKYACHSAASFVRALIQSGVLGILGYDNSRRRASKAATLLLHKDALKKKEDEYFVKAFLGRMLGGEIDIVRPDAS